MKRKLVATLLGIALVASAIFTGCGKTNDTGKVDSGQNTSNEKVTIKYATYSAGPDHIKDLEAMIDEFEKQNENINVEYEVIGFNDYFTKLQTQATSKTLPDVFEINYENFVTYANNGVLKDFTEIAKSDETFDESVLTKGVIDHFKFQDKLYGLTEKFSNVVMYYNKDLFDAAGLEYPQPDWTWEDELKAAKALTKDGVYGTYSPVQYNELYKTVAQNGGSLFDAEGNPTINSKENIEAAQWMIDKMNKYNVQPTPEQMSGKSPEDMFKNGEIAMLRTGSWMLGVFGDVPFTWDIALEPANTDKVHHVFVDGIIASANTKHADAAWKFIKFMSVDPTATKLRVESGWDLPVVDNEEVRESFLSIEKPESREVIFEALETGIVPPTVLNYSRVQDKINEELSKAVIGQVTVEEGLKEAQAKVEKIVK